MCPCVAPPFMCSTLLMSLIPGCRPVYYRIMLPTLLPSCKSIECSFSPSVLLGLARAQHNSQSCRAGYVLDLHDDGTF